MRIIQVFFLLLFLVTTLSCSKSENKGNDMNTMNLNRISSTEWALLTQKKILFSHQSVGENILQGIEEIKPDQFILDNLRQELVGKNGYPFMKFIHFSTLLNSKNRDIQIALMKLCFVDFTEDTNVELLFQRYKTTITILKEMYPDIVFAHITTPLTTNPSWLKSTVKKLMGKSNLNEKRGEYNRLLIQEYAKIDPIFDLATIETDGSTSYSLASKFTDDGGHLNLLGREVVATAFVRFLANISVKNK